MTSNSEPEGKRKQLASSDKPSRASAYSYPSVEDFWPDGGPPTQEAVPDLLVELADRLWQIESTLDRFSSSSGTPQTRHVEVAKSDAEECIVRFETLTQETECLLKLLPGRPGTSAAKELVTLVDYDVAKAPGMFRVCTAREFEEHFQRTFQRYGANLRSLGARLFRVADDLRHGADRHSAPGTQLGPSVTAADSELAGWQGRDRREAAAPAPTPLAAGVVVPKPAEADDQSLPPRASRAAAEAQSPASEAPKPRVSRSYVEYKMLTMLENGMPWCSLREWVERLKSDGVCCAPSTVHNAITHSHKLKEAQEKVRAPVGSRRSPKAQSLNEAVLDRIPSRAPDPADAAAEQEEIDNLLAQLLQDATPEERAKLNEKSPEELRELTSTVLESRRDQHVQDRARGGNRILGRKP